MKKKSGRTEKSRKEKAPSEDLRRRAEEQLAQGSPASLPRGGAPDLVRLVHELQVHQVELSMQNDELRRSQVALQTMRDKYLDLYDSAPAGYLTLDGEGRILESNRAGAALLGVERRTLTGALFTRFVAPGDLPIYTAFWREILHSEVARACEIRLVPDGRPSVFVMVEATSMPETKEGVRAIRAVLVDITGHRRMEQEWVRLERMRALGEMSAGVSHNLNNMLTAVLGPAYLLRQMTNDPDLLREIEDILTAGLRIRDLVHRLHLSTKGLEDDRIHPVGVNELVREALRTTRPRWKDGAEARGVPITTRVELGEVPPILGNGSRFHDIVVNLLLNAVDAMPAGGTISITTALVGERVHVTVRDTGIGMDEEVRRRVFEPFFTTKKDVGSGLGLSTTYNAVTRWGGEISVESEPGKGTVFTMRFSVWHKPEAPERGSGEVRSARRGKLLIVEDDQAVGDFLHRLLSPRHDVEVVRDAHTAQERIAQGGYDVIMVDLGLPGKPWNQVVRELKQKDPSLVTGLVTGWELDEGDPRVSGFDFHIPKPFDDLNEMHAAVARAVALHDARVGRKG